MMPRVILDDDGRLAAHHVDRIVQKWIGVEPPNTLAVFTHNALTDFLQRHCGLPKSHPGVQAMDGVTKVTRFTDAFDAATAIQQAKIIERLMLVAPLDVPAPHADRTEALRAELESYVATLRTGATHQSLEGLTLPAFAANALDDAARLADGGKVPNAVDRLHSALHAVLGQLAAECAPEASTDSITSLFGTVRSKHPAFVVMQGEKPMSRVFRGMGGIIDGANDIRNNNSPAHPTTELLDEPEAKLVYGVLRQLIEYVVRRVKEHSTTWQTVAGPEGPQGWVMYEQQDSKSI